MFRGQFSHTIDAKGRVSVPARFRDLIAASDSGHVVLAPSPSDPCLHLYPLGAWQELEEKIADLPRFDSSVLRFRRMYVSAAVECDMDRSGRVLVTPSHRERAQLEREVLWAGMGRHVELWSRALWEEVNRALSPTEHEAFMARVEELIRI